MKFPLILPSRLINQKILPRGWGRHMVCAQHQVKLRRPAQAVDRTPCRWWKRPGGKYVLGEKKSDARAVSSDVDACRRAGVHNDARIGAIRGEQHRVADLWRRSGEHQVSPARPD